MRYMLDTNICVYIIKEKPAPVIHRLQRTKVTDACISAITLSELEYGVQKSRRIEQNKMALAGFLVPPIRRGCKAGAGVVDMDQGPGHTISGDCRMKSRTNAGLGCWI